MQLRFPRATRAYILGVALAMLMLAFSGTQQAAADVCTGGAPGEASGSASGLAASVAFLASPRWSREALPQWSETSASAAWGDQLAYAWYHDATLWAASDHAAWWVIPGLGCTLTAADQGEAYLREGSPYEPEICLVIYEQLALGGFDCLDPKQLSSPSPPVSLERGGQRFVAGFAAPGSGSVTVQFQNASSTFPATGGVYGGSVSASFGKALSATDLAGALSRPRTPVVLVDQTGLNSSSQGPLASTPRLRRLAAEIHTRIPSVHASILGTAVTGQRAHDEVLYGAGARALASRVARALHASAPSELTGGALRMFATVASVVVLAGRND